jgi:hypothetical protein
MVIDPVPNPKVTLCGKEYELKFSQAALVELRNKHQIDMMTAEAASWRGVEALEKTSKILAYGTAEIINKKLTFHVDPQDILDQHDYSEYPDFFVAIQEAQKKVLDRMNKLIAEGQANGRLFKKDEKLESNPATIQ